MILPTFVQYSLVKIMILMISRVSSLRGEPLEALHSIAQRQRASLGFILQNVLSIFVWKTRH